MREDRALNVTFFYRPAFSRVLSYLLFEYVAVKVCGWEPTIMECVAAPPSDHDWNVLPPCVRGAMVALTELTGAVTLNGTARDTPS